MSHKITREKKALRQIRRKVLKKLSLGLLVPGVFFLFYPFVPWLIELWGHKAGIASGCQALPLAPLTLIFGLSYASLVLSFLPILFGWVKNAVYVLSHALCAAGLFMGGWWLVLSSVFILCKTPPENNIVVLIGLVCFALVTIFVFCFHQRKATKKALEINPHAYDFETMAYTYLSPLIRPDGKDNSQVGMWMVSAGFVGILLARLPIAEWLGFAPLGNEWMMFWTGLFVGYFFLGYLGVGQLYLIWLIHKKGKRVGRSMVVKELL